FDVPSADGTPVPVLLVHRKGLKKDGNNAVRLWGYGAHNAYSPASFERHMVPFLEAGGVLARVFPRGSGQLGTAWHRAAFRPNKQKTIDDMIAAAEWLVAQKITSPKRLAVHGRSSGGLLVGALVTQRPDLFQVGVCLLPWTD